MNRKIYSAVMLASGLLMVSTAAWADTAIVKTETVEQPAPAVESKTTTTTTSEPGGAVVVRDGLGRTSVLEAPATTTVEKTKTTTETAAPVIEEKTTIMKEKIRD